MAGCRRFLGAHENPGDSGVAFTAVSGVTESPDPPVAAATAASSGRPTSRHRVAGRSWQALMYEVGNRREYAHRVGVARGRRGGSKGAIEAPFALPSKRSSQGKTLQPRVAPKVPVTFVRLPVSVAAEAGIGEVVKHR